VEQIEKAIPFLQNSLLPGGKCRFVLAENGGVCRALGGTWRFLNYVRQSALCEKYEKFLHFA
jgi:hypothetical protein